MSLVALSKKHVVSGHLDELCLQRRTLFRQGLRVFGEHHDDEGDGDDGDGNEEADGDDGGGANADAYDNDTTPYDNDTTPWLHCTCR